MDAKSEYDQKGRGSIMNEKSRRRRWGVENEKMGVEVRKMDWGNGEKKKFMLDALPTELVRPHFPMW